MGKVRMNKKLDERPICSKCGRSMTLSSLGGRARIRGCKYCKNKIIPKEGVEMEATKTTKTTKAEMISFARAQTNYVGKEILYMLENNVKPGVLLSEALEAIYNEFKNRYRKATGDNPYPDDDWRSDNYRPFGLYG